MDETSGCPGPCIPALLASTTGKETDGAAATATAVVAADTGLDQGRGPMIDGEDGVMTGGRGAGPEIGDPEVAAEVAVGAEAGATDAPGGTGAGQGAGATGTPRAAREEDLVQSPDPNPDLALNAEPPDPRVGPRADPRVDRRTNLRAVQRADLRVVQRAEADLEIWTKYRHCHLEGSPSRRDGTRRRFGLALRFYTRPRSGVLVPGS